MVRTGNRPSRVPRAPRVSISPLHKVVFLEEGSRIDVVTQVANISTSGIGLIHDDGVFSALNTRPIKRGRLRIGPEEFDVTLKEEWRSNPIIACSIQKADPAFFGILREYFKSEIAALNMIEVRPELLQSPPSGKAFCFRGNNNCEIYFILEGATLGFFSLSFFGNTVEGKPGKSLQFGRIKEDHDFEKPSYKGSQLIYSSPVPTAEFLTEVIRFVESTQGIEPKVKDEICEQIRLQQARL